MTGRAAAARTGPAEVVVYLPVATAVRAAPGKEHDVVGHAPVVAEEVRPGGSPTSTPAQSHPYLTDTWNDQPPSSRGCTFVPDMRLPRHRGTHGAQTDSRPRRSSE